MSVKKKSSSEKTIPEVSPRSTKDQILSAYNEMVELLEEKQVQSPLEEKKKGDERAVITKSSQTSLDGIVSHLANLKITLTKQIDTLSENLLEEFNKLSELKQAITIEQNHLQELYQIKETAHSLSALLLIQKEENIEMSYDEIKEKLEKQHKREEEEYKYTLALTRRQESQAFALKQEALEKELEDKRQDLA